MLYDSADVGHGGKKKHQELLVNQASIPWEQVAAEALARLRH